MRLGFGLRTLRITEIAAGIVVAAPMATSILPIACRRVAGIRSDNRRAIPPASAARVPTTNANVGRLRTTFFIETSSVIALVMQAVRPAAGTDATAELR